MILKPWQLEGSETKTPAQKRAKKLELFKKQRGICACGCNRPMTLEGGRMDTATLEHITPNKMGCRKNDADKNLAVTRWDCNQKKGSQRVWKGNPL